MENMDYIKKQADLAKQTLAELNNQNRIFGKLLDDGFNKAAEGDKVVMNKLKATCKRAVNLAKQGKTNEATDIINKFKKDYAKLWESK